MTTFTRPAIGRLALATSLLAAALVPAATVAASLAFAETPPAPAPAPPPSAPVPKARQAPNVLVWMMDDVGFGQLSSYGGLVDTPNIDRVAASGLRYANYHTAPICSAARASFLTGRMPHSVHVGGHSTAAMPYPGYDAHIPRAAGTLAANLKAAGFATYAVGKWDHLPNATASPAGPFDYWPQGQGFDRFYGFLAADADNFHPTLVNDVSPVARPQDEDYHLSADMAERAIAMIDAGHARHPARPFFLYWATGAAHAPHHAPAEWIERYRGRFDKGWDKVREEVLQRQVERGIVPAGTRLAPTPEGMPDWDELSPDAQQLYARQMEAFAASLAYADAQFGRLLDHLEASGQRDDTMIVIVSDNGASAEGGPNGLSNEAQVAGGKAPDIADNMRFYDSWGSAATYPHYAYGWALAGDTPFRYWKQTTHEGGTRVPLVISWPSGIAARGEIRQDFVHVADIAPTVLEATASKLAETINGVKQVPMEGSSILASFAKAGSPREAPAQYVELYGNKGLWQDGWAIVTSHRSRTWDWKTAPTFDEPWELYDLVTDPGQTTDLAGQHPERVAEMAAAFDAQAAQYNVKPIHNLSDTAKHGIGKVIADFRRRNGKWSYPGPVGNIPNELAPPVSSQGFTMRAAVELDDPAVTAPIFAFGGQMGGIALYLVEGRPTLRMNGLDSRGVSIAADTAIPAGASALEMRFDKQARAGSAPSYHVTISANGRVLVEQDTDFALPWYFGLSETFGIGIDNGSPVLPGAVSDMPFPGSLSRIEFQFDPAQSPFPEIGH